jgi:prevent-host-death family protein
MKNSSPIWSSAQAKASLSKVIELSQERPQIIEKHGKPAAAVIGWNRYRSRQTELAGTMKEWIDDLTAINKEEGEMDEIIRTDRHLPADF